MRTFAFIIRKRLKRHYVILGDVVHGKITWKEYEEIKKKRKYGNKFIESYRKKQDKLNEKVLNIFKKEKVET
jgi:hypothetical protein